MTPLPHHIEGGRVEGINKPATRNRRRLASTARHPPLKRSAQKQTTNRTLIRLPHTAGLGTRALFARYSKRLGWRSPVPLEERRLLVRRQHEKLSRISLLSYRASAAIFSSTLGHSAQRTYTARAAVRRTCLRPRFLSKETLLLHPARARMASDARQQNIISPPLHLLL